MRCTIFARVENLFDEDYETFGLLGEPQEVFPEMTDPRFLGAGPPFGALGRSPAESEIVPALRRRSDASPWSASAAVRPRPPRG